MRIFYLSLIFIAISIKGFVAANNRSHRHRDRYQSCAIGVSANVVVKDRSGPGTMTDEKKEDSRSL